MQIKLESLASKIENDNNKASFGKDLLMGTVFSVPASTVGYICSFLNPFVVPGVIYNIREGKKIFARNRIERLPLADFFVRVSLLGGYGLGVYHIVSNITENPHDPVKYWPIATNLFGGLVMAYFEDRKKR